MSADQPMSLRAATVRLVLAAVACFVMFALLVALLGNYSTRRGHGYHALFTDATGLHVRDDVRIAGVSVGRVDKVELDHGRAKVSFTVLGDARLTTATEATLRYRNLLGQRYLSLTVPNGSGSQLAPGSTIPLDRTHPALSLTAVFNGFRPLFQGLSPDKVNRLASAIVATLQGEGGNIGTLLAQTADLTGTLAQRDVALGQILDDLSSVAGTVASRDRGLRDLVAELQRLTSTLAADRTSIGEALSGADALAASLNGLLVDIRPPLRTLLPPVASTLRTAAANQKKLDAALAALPLGLDPLVRATSYGSWLNVYVCDLSTAAGRIGTDTHSVVCR
jgi:phospholipid/cholesterol/gamma-HCH transport system substrate-binding protein